MSLAPLLSVAHCNVNCSSITRSREFYGALLGLGTGTHTKPDPQDGRGFGIDGDAAWDAWMMHDHRGPFTAPVVDLLEWLVPVPTGAPYGDPTAVGLANLRFAVPSIADLRGRLDPGTVQGAGPDSLGIVDPDGTRLVFVEADVPGIEYRGVTVNCSDLGHSMEWYQRVLGVEPTIPGAVAGSLFGADPVATAAVSLPGRAEVFTISFESWGTGGRAYAEANHLGIFRMAFIVDDIDAWYDSFRSQGVECFSPPVTLDMGPEIPIDGLRALFFPDPDGACLELIESVR